MKEVDLTGKKFGLLTAVERIRKDNKTFYLCDCECGNRVRAPHGDLQRGRKKSCGVCIPRRTKRPFQAFVEQFV